MSRVIARAITDHGNGCAKLGHMNDDVSDLVMQGRVAAGVGCRPGRCRVEVRDEA